MAQTKKSQKTSKAAKSTKAKTSSYSKNAHVDETSKSSQKSNKLISRKSVIIGLAILLVVGLLYYFRSLFVVATVNGEPINRIAFIKDLEKTAGKQSLDTMVTKTLIMQEARKQNITVSAEELAAETAKVEQSLKDSGQSLDQALAMQGLSRSDFEEQLRFQKMIEKMVGSDVAVSDAEVTKYMEENKDSLPETAEATEAAALKTSVKEQLRQQKLSEKVQTWLSNLQKDAKINYYVKF